MIPEPWVHLTIKRADLILDAVGSPPTRKAASASGRCPVVRLSISACRRRETGLDTRYFTLQEVTFAGTYCYSRYDFSAAALKLLVTRDLIQNRDWIEVRPLDEGALRDFIDIHEGKAPPKIILEICSRAKRSCNGSPPDDMICTR